jgi:hypothetical protein
MPSTFKKLVRARQATTGESYQAAARHVREQGEAPAAAISAAVLPPPARRDQGNAMIAPWHSPWWRGDEADPEDIDDSGADGGGWGFDQ